LAAEAFSLMIVTGRRPPSFVPTGNRTMSSTGGAAADPVAQADDPTIPFE
jgi:hypothetical protein